MPPNNLGSQADTAVVDSTANASITALLKGLLALALGSGSGSLAPTVTPTTGAMQTLSAETP
ncbi:hypothetical protein ACFLWA_12695, partial [Chloroflexota bacterium]